MIEGYAYGEARAELRALAKDVLTIGGDRAMAPGSPITLRAVEGEGPTIEGRTIGSRREPDGRFEVRVRLVSFTREQRGWLVERLG